MCANFDFEAADCVDHHHWDYANAPDASPAALYSSPRGPKIARPDGREWTGSGPTGRLKPNSDFSPERRLWSSSGKMHKLEIVVQLPMLARKSAVQQSKNGLACAFFHCLVMVYPVSLTEISYRLTCLLSNSFGPPSKEHARQTKDSPSLMLRWHDRNANGILFWHYTTGEMPKQNHFTS